MISRSKKRIQVSLSNLTMNDLETFANNNGIAKSLVIELALNDYLIKERIIITTLKIKKKHSGGVSSDFWFMFLCYDLIISYEW